MKKNFAITAALAAMFALPALSHGAAQIWWTLDGGDASLVSSGVGQALVVETGDAAQVYSFTATMWANVTAPALYSANTTLSADGPVAASSWVAVPPTGGAETPAGGLNTPGAGDIATNFGAATFSGPGYIGNDINLGTLTFTIDKTGGPTGAVNIFARVGNGLFGTSDFGTATVDYGPNLGVNGGVVGASGNMPVITINEAVIPEPATLSLFGIGVLALIRRRR